MEFIETFNPDGTHGSPKLPAGIKNYLIDIDGTICDDIPNEEPERIPLAKEFTGAKDKINGWYDAGHVITFFTSRVEDHRPATEAWLNEHGFKYHKMIMGKPRGGNYHWIDDRDVECTKFTSWDLL
jgi:hypothetical protein